MRACGSAERLRMQERIVVILGSGTERSRSERAKVGGNFV